MNVRAYTNLVQPFVGNNNQIEQVFGIPSTKVLTTTTKLLNVAFVPSEELGRIELVLTYRELSNLEYEGYEMLDTLKDTQGIIYSFLRDTFRVTIELDFRDHWPFWAPKIKVTHTNNNNYNIDMLVKRFNCDLRAGWSPALGFEKTVLMLLTLILEAIHYV